MACRGSGRVTVDIDGRDRRLDMVRAVYNIMFHGYMPRVYLTRHGWHIQFIVSNHSVDDGLYLRSCYGDDSGRLAIDERKHHWGLGELVDTAFEVKVHVDGKVFRRREIYI